VETATSPAGPWKTITDFTSAGALPINYSLGASTGEELSVQLERYLRWAIDCSGMTGADTQTWDLCFGICVTLK